MGTQVFRSNIVGIIQILLNHRFHSICQTSVRNSLCMIKGPLQPTQRAFVKQVLGLFAIILVLVPVVYAEDDKWIDGIMYRWANSEIGRAHV